MHERGILSRFIFGRSGCGLVDMQGGEKVRKLSKTAAKIMSTPKWISTGYPLWKTPVDKSVEIVEKFGFSTGITGFLTVEQGSKK